MRKIYKSLIIILISGFIAMDTVCQHSIAREWNEVLLENIRDDFARPTVHARNLWHSSAMMYDIWAVFDSIAKPYFLGNEINGYQIDFDGFDTTGDREAKIDEAISYAMYTLMQRRFALSPNPFTTNNRLRNKMMELGYNPTFNETDYSDGNAAAFGNFVAQSILAYGLQDGSREASGYNNGYYNPVNQPMVIQNPGNPNLQNPNNWQQLTLDVFIDQSGNEIPFNTPRFLSAEWGNVVPFALSEEDLTSYTKDDSDVYNVYLDPGPPPMIDFDDPDGSYDYIRGFELVLKWSSQLDPADQKMIDISPASNGNNTALPESVSDILSFYDYENGGDHSEGHDINPYTGAPYEPQMVPSGDYTRVLAEFWADGPDSETPPGHWFSILNYVTDHPENKKQYEGTGDAYGDLEWDIKTYFMLGGAMHDAAIAAWGAKGYYDYIRPVSAIRYIAGLGQRSDPSLPSYSPFGFELVEDFVELVDEDDPLVGNSMEHLNKLKAKVWRGPDYINNPSSDKAGVGWILIENWWPYQRPSFVTPPFAGYVSGHSTYSRAAAEILTKITGDAFFPGGMGVFDVEENDFLVFEQGPSESFSLQWATYRDASDETSLSRIWGGIHPPADDIPGRIMGVKIADRVFEKSENYFFVDEDGDGFFSYEDCNDLDSSINPSSPEICDDLDNNCDGFMDEDLPTFTYYLDIDNDGYGNADESIAYCSVEAPQGYTAIANDCDDQDASINPDSNEICDNIDNDCNDEIDDNIPYFSYYKDSDGDGFGDSNSELFICDLSAPAGYVTDSSDCDDQNVNINPDSSEICDNIDNDCNDEIDDNIPYFSYYRDSDGDGFGDSNSELSICDLSAPAGYVTDSSDCDDQNVNINPDSSELCDNIDNDCNNEIDDNIPYFSYYRDSDGDGFGNRTEELFVCELVPPTGYVTDNTDCDDDSANIYPDATEVSDNNVDEDCNGFDFYEVTNVFPNPFSNSLTIHINKQEPLRIALISSIGKLVYDGRITGHNNIFTFDDLFFNNKIGIYYLYILSESGEVLHYQKLIKL